MWSPFSRAWSQFSLREMWSVESILYSVESVLSESVFYSVEFILYSVESIARAIFILPNLRQTAGL